MIQENEANVMNTLQSFNTLNIIDLLLIVFKKQTKH